MNTRNKITNSVYWWESFDTACLYNLIDKSPINLEANEWELKSNVPSLPGYNPILHNVKWRDGEDIELFITLVPKVI